MFNVNEDTNSICFNFSSDMHLVDRVIKTCRDYMEQLNISMSSEFRIVLRELLINAIEHGNKNNTQKTVKCSIYNLGQLRFKIVVKDQGNGFDYNSLITEIPDNPKQIRNRGYGLINNFADIIEFNDKGNTITAYFSISQDTTFEIAEKDGYQIIIPSGDITASITDKLRKILIKLADQGFKKYKFDFANVEDIDSMGLSILIIFSKMLDKQHKDKKLEIINADKSVMELFHITRIDKIYNLSVDACS